MTRQQLPKGGVKNELKLLIFRITQGLRVAIYIPQLQTLIVGSLVEIISTNKERLLNVLAIRDCNLMGLLP